VFRLGQLLDPPKGPGLFIVVPVIDRMVKDVDRVQSHQD